MKNKFILLGAITASLMLSGCNAPVPYEAVTQSFDLPEQFQDCVVANVNTKIVTKENGEKEGGHFAFIAMRCKGDSAIIQYNEQHEKTTTQIQVVVNDETKQNMENGKKQEMKQEGEVNKPQVITVPKGFDLQGMSEFKVGADTYKLENPEDVKILDGQVFRKVKMR